MLPGNLKKFLFRNGLTRKMIRSLRALLAWGPAEQTIATETFKRFEI